VHAHGEFAADREAKTRSAESLERRRSELHVWLEDVAQTIAGNSGSVVADVEAHRVRVSLTRDAHHAALTAELHRVRREIDEDLFQLVAVGGHEQPGARRGFERDVVARRQRRDDGVGDADRLGRRHGRDLVGHVPGLEPRERDQIVDDVDEHLFAVVHAREEACLFRGRLIGGADAEQVDVPGDRLQRRPQLVTHPREELDLGAPRLLATFAGSFGVGPSPGLADGDDDETRALLDQSHHTLARRARLTEHHHQLADGLSVDGEQRNELDAPEAERAGEGTERVVAFQCVAHDDATMLQQSDAERVGAGRV